MDQLRVWTRDALVGTTREHTSPILNVTSPAPEGAGFLRGER